jgi:hypothetical protein
MQYVPNFGPAGVIVAAGGLKQAADASENRLISFGSVQVYDPATNNWYEQTTTGSIPKGRKEYCMTGAASSNNTYEIVVYAGWDGNLGKTSIPWDELFVLSLPSFHWFRADYQAIQPRHGLTCEHIGGGQVLTIGGVDTTQVGPDSLYDGVFNTRDPHAQGLAIFDLSSLSFTTGYMSNRTVYTLAPDVQSYYNNKSVPGGSRARLVSGMLLTVLHFSSNRLADFTHAGLAEVFTVENFTAAAIDATGTSGGPSGAADSGNGSASPSTTSEASSVSEGVTKSNTGAIAGGVAGGVVGVAIIGAAVLLLLRRRRSNRSRLEQNSHGGGVGEKMHRGADDIGGFRNAVTHAEMPGPTSPRLEAEGSTPQTELPAWHRYELS